MRAHLAFAHIGNLFWELSASQLRGHSGSQLGEWGCQAGSTQASLKHDKGNLKKARVNQSAAKRRPKVDRHLSLRSVAFSVQHCDTKTIIAIPK